MSPEELLDSKLCAFSMLPHSPKFIQLLVFLIPQSLLQKLIVFWNFNQQKSSFCIPTLVYNSNPYIHMVVLGNFANIRQLPIFDQDHGPIQLYKGLDKLKDLSMVPELIDDGIKTKPQAYRLPIFLLYSLFLISKIHLAACYGFSYKFIILNLRKLESLK